MGKLKVIVDGGGSAKNGASRTTFTVKKTQYVLLDSVRIEIMLNDSLVKTSTTDKNGSTPIITLVPGNYSVKATKNGYDEYTFPNVAIQADVTQYLAIDLTSKPTKK